MLSAGPYFECELAWAPSSALCVEGSCAAGTAAKLTATVEYCYKSGGGELNLDLSVCVDVISDVVALLEEHVPLVENTMNNHFDVYGGCLRMISDISVWKLLPLEKNIGPTLYFHSESRPIVSQIMFVYLHETIMVVSLTWCSSLQLGCVLREMDVLIAMIKPGSQKN